MASSAMTRDEESALAMFLLMAAQEEEDNRDRRRKECGHGIFFKRGEMAVLREFGKRAVAGDCLKLSAA